MAGEVRYVLRCRALKLGLDLRRAGLATTALDTHSHPE
jgi:hypothetical protein